MLDVNDPIVRNFVTNYKINLLIPHEIQDFSLFKTSNKQVFEFISCSKDEKKMENLLKGNEYKKVPVDIANILSLCTGTNLNINESEEVVDVCKAWADHEITATKKTAMRIAKSLFESGSTIEYVKENIEDLTEEEILKIFNEVQAEETLVH